MADGEGTMDTQTLDRSLCEILEAVSDGVFVTAGEQEIVFWNKGAERITGFSSDEVLNQHCYDDILVYTDTSGKNLCFDGCPLQQSIETGAAERADHRAGARSDFQNPAGWWQLVRSRLTSTS
jgi:PAS domain S-box-containing protein